MTGYCMKCKERREIQNAQAVTMKNGRAVTRGSCSECRDDYLSTLPAQTRFKARSLCCAAGEPM